MPRKDPEAQREYIRQWREANKQTCIYALTDPETRKIRYVGSTSNIKERLRLHWEQREWRGTPLAGWLCTLSEPPGHEVLQEVSPETRWEAEEYWTNLLRQVDTVDLLNVFTGHKNPGGYKRPPEFGAKLSALYQERKAAGLLPAREYPRGESNGSARLTEDDVRAIRASSDSLRVLAEEYGVSWISIRNIRIGKTWKHVE